MGDIFSRGQFLVIEELAAELLETSGHAHDLFQHEKWPIVFDKAL